MDSRTPDQLNPLSTIRLLQTDVNTNYNALQLRAEKRYTQGLTLVASFNYQKAMGIGYEINSGADSARKLRRIRESAFPIGGVRSSTSACGLSSAISGSCRSSETLPDSAMCCWVDGAVNTLASGLPVTVTQNGDSQNTGDVGSAARPRSAGPVRATSHGRPCDRALVQHWRLRAIEM